MFSLAFANRRPVAALLRRRKLRAINERAATLEGFADEALRSASLALRHRARSGEPPRKLSIEAFALVREAARRTIGLRHFDVQIIGGMVLCECGLAEMQTGEGKTLTATLPLYLFGLYGRGAHLATVNDYLARRDADQMRPVFAALGLSVGVIESDTKPGERRASYACDITYGTGKEFGFDFLRDRLLLRSQDDAGSDLVGRLLGEADPRRSEKPLQRDPFFMLVDEADSVLIDDAGTPLLIASSSGDVPPDVAARYRFAAGVTKEFSEHEHYTLDARTQRVDLTYAGRERLRGIHPPAELGGVGLVTMYEDVERAILVDRRYSRDRNYVVRDGEIAIVDEFTGRIAEGRKWQSGIHQAVEAKEGLEITDDAGGSARITVQEFFKRYRNLAGMSGTATDSATELRRIYNLRVAAIPTNRPPIRRRFATRLFATADAKWRAVVEEVREMQASGQPVLIGTRSIDKSELVARLLTEQGVEHRVLNACHEEREAEIVASAGERARVTVATNMAGRGTDVRLAEGVAELGGMHVIVTEMHEAARIDRQLIGRCGRQGDPGSFRFLLSLEDDLLKEGLGARRAEKLRRETVLSGGEHPRLERKFRRAQINVERKKFRNRKQLLAFEKDRNKAARPVGLDPHLDLPG
jgi:preprotein translocase subunit SecA